MQKSSRQNREYLVLVERNLSGSGLRGTRRKMWVVGDNVRPDDVVLANSHNVRPYRYAGLGEKKRAAATERTPLEWSGREAAYQRKVAALFNRVLEAAGRK